ncbi:hypothetical protein Marpi_1189 [Marinitoga piezophila KA3]|uniref:Uncharacterized protein n=1 Tax=Marinitoga piezophila (strain DSM 14283 / JCM 11233 / KA3) TaxID=443254 RepID=H2J8B3_MARPK|nr:hypothetical protein [Marinitoga piezophila]AEX85597.1 hypothetical protein Marpi_1189 [Marinitoga piezophila KA3]
MHLFFKISILLVFIISFFNVLFSFIYGIHNFYNIFLVEYYKLNLEAISNIRFPGIFGMTYTAGIWFVFYMYIAIYYDYNEFYKFLILLIGVFANTKVFYLSVPFILMEYYYKYKINTKYSIKKKFKFKNIIYICCGIFFVIFVFVTLKNFNSKYFYTLLLRSKSIILNDPLAGRGYNIVAQNIRYIINNNFWHGVGFLKTPYTLFNYGLWDSGFNYMLNFGGVINLIFQSIFYIYLFWEIFKTSRYKIISYIFLINWYLINLGTLAFYAERISDIIFLYLGLEYGYSKLAIINKKR